MDKLTTANYCPFMKWKIIGLSALKLKKKIDLNDEITLHPALKSVNG